MALLPLVHLNMTVIWPYRWTRTSAAWSTGYEKRPRRENDPIEPPAADASFIDNDLLYCSISVPWSLSCGQARLTFHCVIRARCPIEAVQLSIHMSSQ